MIISARLNHAVSLPDLIRNEKMGRLIKQDAPYSFENAHLRRQMTICDSGLARSDDRVWCGYHSHLICSAVLINASRATNCTIWVLLTLTRLALPRPGVPVTLPRDLRSGSLVPSNAKLRGYQGIAEGCVLVGLYTALARPVRCTLC
jgi:hypothetical protein